MQLGMLLTFWATPTMTVGHLVLAASMSAYVLIGIRFEERSLLKRFGENYADYRKTVPMLMPLLPTVRGRRRGNAGARETR